MIVQIDGIPAQVFHHGGLISTAKKPVSIHSNCSDMFSTIRTMNSIVRTHSTTSMRVRTAVHHGRRRGWLSRA